MAPIPEKNMDETPSRGEEVADMETPPVNLTVESDSSSGEDDDVIGLAPPGYQLLPQEANAQGDFADDESSLEPGNFTQQDGEHSSPGLSIDDVITTVLNPRTYPAVGSNIPENSIDAEVAERKELWSKPRPEAVAMATEEAEKIKAAMSNFTLPSCAQPEWAKSVSEDEWKKRLYAKLKIPHVTNCSSTNQLRLNTPKHSTDGPDEGRQLSAQSDSCDVSVKNLPDA